MKCFGKYEGLSGWRKECESRTLLISLGIVRLELIPAAPFVLANNSKLLINSQAMVPFLSQGVYFADMFEL